LLHLVGDLFEMVPIERGIIYFRIENKSNDREASMSTTFKTVIWNSLSLRKKYTPHENKRFLRLWCRFRM